MSMQHLLIAGGGTGGHIAPAIAVGERASGEFRVSYACTPRPVDKLMYADIAAACQVHVMDPPRLDKGMKLVLPFTAARALLKARKLLRSTDVTVVLGTGGYSSFFAILAARTLGIPAAIFDSNAIPGRSNRISSRFCRVAFTGLPGGKCGLECPVILTGTPVGNRLKKISSSSAKQSAGIPQDRPVLLFLGGSQGAKAINDLALSIRGEVSILLQCGNSDYQRVIKQAEGRSNFVVEPFVDDLSLWYSAADLAVARSGGQTIAELSFFELPAVFVPYPYAAEDHQTANAEAVERVGGALVRSQKETGSSGFMKMLLQVVNSTEELTAMGTAMRTLFPSNPAGEIVSNLRELLQ
ncbi:MAG: UDP-N-acetylglucosamine--N-acetylmuramyl-(pentapeptide) pyrophosphoryl-undecaprenol N-acetylglucosamine transferase [Candidatus Sabulitectum sp.]|nr:UDP-N-acetylglucosamine--N-acetylmuramyl-(pentapeptide) pyrophosphoryl-undecaprenol N-acetylglucosamine transferase [Candidatus Sabulitectum sp.]